MSVVGTVTAQVINNAPSFNIKNYQVLPNAGYSLKKILTDTTLKFAADSVLRPAAGKSYWVKAKCYNPYPNTEKYIVSISGPVNNTLYYADSTQSKWLASPAGLSASNGRRLPFTVPFTLHPKAWNTFYLKVDLGNIDANGRPIQLDISLDKEISFSAREKAITTSYLICFVALMSFLCYNLYIYFLLKDKVYLYYVYAQLGALLYITGTYRYCNVLFPIRLFIQNPFTADGYVEYFNINSFFIHLGVSLIFWGFAQFTRCYLNTKELLPRCDKLIQILANTYIAIEATHTLLTITGIYFFEPILLDNIFVLAVIASCVVSGFIAYKSRAKAALHFLAAILLPVIFTALQSGYIIIYEKTSPLFPVIAVLSQILTFAVALVARVKLINEDLHEKALRAVKLENERLLMEQENMIITLSIELEKERNAKLQHTLEANQRELVGNSVYIHQKNKLLADLKIQVKDIGALYPDADIATLKSIQSSIKDSEYLDEEWDKFKIHFEQLHPSFFTNLQASHPKLTKYELRLYAYFHINMSTKEIATLLNIAPSSVRQAKARLNKKMNC